VWGRGTEGSNPAPSSGESRANLKTDIDICGFVTVSLTSTGTALTVDEHERELPSAGGLASVTRQTSLRWAEFCHPAERQRRSRVRTFGRPIMRR
jgi:hypothetical protein